MFFELFDEDTAGVRPGVLFEPRPQERVQRHVVEHITDLVRVAPMVQILDAPEQHTVEQLQDNMLVFDTLLPIPVQVIEVPKILLDDVPMRAVLRDTQLVEQLVEVPTLVSYSSLLLLQRDSGAKRWHSSSWSWWAIFWSSRLSPGQSATAPQFAEERISERIVEQIVDFRFWWRSSRFSLRTEAILAQGGSETLLQQFRLRRVRVCLWTLLFLFFFFLFSFFFFFFCICFFLF